VSLQAAIEQKLPLLRREAEARMIDTWAIGADVGWTYDPDADGGNGADVQTVTPLFTTRARLKASSGVVHNTEGGGRTIVETRRELHIPWDSAAVPTNAVAQCTAIHASTDPTVLGTIVRLAGPAPGSQTTARRLEVTEVLT
jgi:hypothetical protein